NLVPTAPADLQFFATNVLPSTPRTAQVLAEPLPGRILTSDGGEQEEALLAQAASSALSGQGLQNQDAYWSLLDRRQGDPIIDANSWAADQLALALDGNAPQDVPQWSAPI